MITGAWNALAFCHLRPVVTTIRRFHSEPAFGRVLLPLWRTVQAFVAPFTGVVLDVNASVFLGILRQAHSPDLGIEPHPIKIHQSTFPGIHEHNVDVVTFRHGL